VGDADGDGKHDFLVIRALPARPNGGRGMAALLQPWCESATAFVVGLDGKVIADLSPRVDPDWRSPLAAPAADVDGDGRADVFVEVAYEEGKLPLEVRSLAKGAVLKFKGDAVSGPQSIAVCGDVDGDKKPDFLFGRTSSVRKEFHGEVRVVSGKDGHAIRSVTGFKQGDRLGASVAAMPDVDGDGVPDFAAGAPGMEPKKELSDAGGVVAFSGKSGKVLWTVKGEGAFGSLGESIALVDDVDGDGVPDLVAGAPGFGPDDKGRALVLSGKTGKTLLTFAGK
jgi:hypothetical protein